jgi:hypothetical protein
MNPPASFPQPPAPVHPVIVRKRTFFGAIVWGLSVLVLTVVICVTLIIICGGAIAARQTHNVLGSIESAARGLSTLQESLPPILADVIRDERRPDYAKQIEVRGKALPRPEAKAPLHVSIEAANRGSELVSLLTLRVVVLNQNNEPIAERNEWVATPIATDKDGRGPLLPGSVRRMVSCPIRIDKQNASDDLRVEVEISDVRVWKPEKPLGHPTTRRAEKVTARMP